MAEHFRSLGPSAAAIGLLVACGGPDRPPGFDGFEDETVLESKHFRMHLHAADPDACSAALDELEHHLGAISGYLSLPAPPPRKLDYYKFASIEELQALHACSNPKSPACVHGTQLMTSRLFDAHELIHAYVDGPRPPWVIIEGLADAMSCGYGPWSRPRDHASFEEVSALSWQDLASWIPSAGPSDVTYYRAGTQLVRYLVDHAGVDALMAYYRSERTGDAVADVDADFRAAFAQPLADAWAAALQLDLPGGPCLTPFECSHEPLALGQSWSEVAACGVGYRYRTFELSEPTSLVLDAPGAADHRGERDSLDMLLSCDGLQASPTWTSFLPPALATRLDAGKYALVLPVPEQEVQLTLSAGGLTTTCSEARNSALAISASTLKLAAPATSDTWYAGFTAAPPQTADIYASQVQPVPARLCAGCDAADVCEPVTTERKPFDLPASSVLVIPTENRPGAFSEFGLTPK